MEDQVIQLEEIQIQNPEALPMERLYQDEDGNVCVILDSSEVADYMPMVPVETTEEVVMYSDIKQEEESIIEVDDGYALFFSEKYPEAAVPTDRIKRILKKSNRRGQHQCKVCNKTFSQTINLVTHERIHTGEKPFVCSICGKAFSQQPNLWKHMRTHTGERPYQCITCKKRFTQQANLAKHIRIHTGERPYTCTYCGRTFTQQANLTKHVRLHTGERPFQCSYCTKTFVQQSNLERHERIHTGEKPFKCPICTDSFAQNAHLAKHLRSIHKAEPGSSTYYVRVNCQNKRMECVKDVEKLAAETVSIEQPVEVTPPPKIGIPVLFCPKTGKIIKRID